MAHHDPRLRISHLSSLPQGWLGKNHALWCGAGIASGELLLFTDADIIMEPTTLSRAVNLFLAERLDHLASEAALQFAVNDTSTVRVAIDGLRSSTTWQRATTAQRWWREMPMDGTVDGVVMAAIADLVWQLPNGDLAVADWKTDSGTAEILTDNYTGQLNAYARLLESATGLTVSERIIVAVHPRTSIVTEVTL